MSQRSKKIQKKQDMNNILNNSEDQIQTTYGLRRNLPTLQDSIIQTPQSPKLQNIVSTVNLNCNINLKKIALEARNAEYNPRRFAAVVMRLRQPKTTALVFASGKMVCTGAKNEEASKIACRKFARIIQKLGNPVQFTQFKIQNVVGSCDVGFSIDLEHIAQKHHDFCSYEPEVFPGLVYKMIEPKLVLLIFVSGKVVLTGAKRKKDIDTAFDKIFPVLEDGIKKRIES